MTRNNLLFWQPRYDYLRHFERTSSGRVVVVVLNYLIWPFLFYVSYLLIKSNTNIFWQILIATILGEIVERYGKSHALWRRPLYQRHDATPVGLVDRWYKTGSFPSGHTIKAIFFLLFLLQYPVFPVIGYLLPITFLLFFRVLIGFHYPIDMLGGALIGLVIWFISHSYIGPEFITHLIRVIFNFVFHL